MIPQIPTIDGQPQRRRRLVQSIHTAFNMVVHPKFRLPYGLPGPEARMQNRDDDMTLHLH